MPKKFQRKIEDFICQHCGLHVSGDGYTNHCPNCLWSRHVDINPGDRAHTCGGSMEPVRVETKSKDYLIVHKCQKCGAVKRNKTQKNDNFETILELSAKNS